MRRDYDAVVIGAGPAGMACATTLVKHGLEPVVLDEQKAPGGQIYRNISAAAEQQRTVLGEDYRYGLSLVEAFTGSGADYLARARVWQADPEGTVYLSRDGASAKVVGRYIVICTGAMERPVPFPGWTLPGVMTCGGMSNLYKDSGLVPAAPVVLAGSGPLLWLVAEHLLALEAPLAAILDTSRRQHAIGALREAPQAVKRLDFLLKGVKMLNAVRKGAAKRSIPLYRGVNGLKAEGGERLERVRATCGGRRIDLAAATLLVTEGIIPNTALLRQVGCRHRWDPVQRYWHPDTKKDGFSSLGSVLVAGDGAFVHGAKAAEYKGEMAALAIARNMHRLNAAEYRDEAERLGTRLGNELYPRPFIDALYRPRRDLYELSDETLVCRCEGITAGRIRELVRQGYVDHNEIKAIIRCGMGPCQGRMCTSAVHELIAAGSGRPPQALRPHRLRPPIKPVSLTELANADIGDDDES